MTDAAAGAAPTRWTETLPVGLFGSVMGLTGLSLVWRAAHLRYQAPAWIADVLAMVAVSAFVLILAAYAHKLSTAPAAVRAEFRHPVGVNMFATFWVSLLLLPTVLAPVSLPLARALWVVGAAGMAASAGYIVSRWLSARHEREHVAPAWMLPVVGLLDLPLAVPALGWPQLHGLMVASLAVGLFFAVPLFTLIVSRLVFESPLPGPLQPTLLILVAPAAVGTSAYVTTTARVDLFAQSLFAITLFLLAVLLGRLRHLPRCCPFKLSWWAVSFPLAACAIAAFRVAEATPSVWTETTALVLTALSTTVMGWLLGRTLLGIARGEMRQLQA